MDLNFKYIYFPRLFEEKRRDIVFGIPSFRPSFRPSLSTDYFLSLFPQVELSHFSGFFFYQSEWIVGILCAHLLLQFYIDSFETSHVRKGGGT